MYCINYFHSNYKWIKLIKEISFAQQRANQEKQEFEQETLETLKDEQEFTRKFDEEQKRKEMEEPDYVLIDLPKELICAAGF